MIFNRIDFVSKVCSHGDVRLKNRRAEVCISGIWAASICTDDSSNYSTLGKSVCKQVFGVEQSCKLFSEAVELLYEDMTHLK